MLEYCIDEWKVDYWKSEVIAFVVEFLIFLRCRFQGDGNGKKYTFEYQ
jgi:hypothetical protein